MAPSAQNVQTFITSRHNVSSSNGGMSLEERRALLSRQQPTSPLALGRKRSIHSLSPHNVGGFHAASFQPTVRKPYGEIARGDRFDTDTEHLEDSTRSASVAETNKDSVSACNSSLESEAEAIEAGSYADETRSEMHPHENTLHQATLVGMIPKSTGGTLQNKVTAWANGTLQNKEYVEFLTARESRPNGNHHVGQRQNMLASTVPHHTHARTLDPRHRDGPALSRSRDVEMIPEDRADIVMTKVYGQSGPHSLTNGHAMVSGNHAHQQPSPVVQQDTTSHPLATSNHPINHPDDGEFLPITSVNGASRVRFTSVSCDQTPPLDRRGGLHQHSVSLISHTSSCGDLRNGLPSSRRFRTQASHVRPLRPAERPIELDHSQTQFSEMEYATLKDESFDYDPKAAPYELPLGLDSLEEKLEYVKKLPCERRSEEQEYSSQGHPQNSPQEIFFASLMIDEYEDCGDLIVQQLSELMQRLAKLRRTKRDDVRAFEAEIASREVAVSHSLAILQQDLNRLRRGGEEVVRGTA